MTGESFRSFDRIGSRWRYRRVVRRDTRSLPEVSALADPTLPTDLFI
jgi:hypothetical protein